MRRWKLAWTVFRVAGGHKAAVNARIGRLGRCKRCNGAALVDSILIAFGVRTPECRMIKFMSSSFVPLLPADSTASALRDARRHGCNAALRSWADSIVEQGRRTVPHSAGPLTLLDADFNTGTLFLLLRAAWLANPGSQGVCQARLHVVAVVPRPYSRDALRAIYADAGMPADLKAGASLLIDQWPHLLPGQHRLRFDEGRVSLTVLFGAPEQTLARAGFVADGFTSGVVDLQLAK